MRANSGKGEVAFRSHLEAQNTLSLALRPNFYVIIDAHLESSQIPGRMLKIDLLAVEAAQPHRAIGFEVKARFYRMSDYAHAIKQAADYRLAAINDARVLEFGGYRLAFTFVFPRWHGGHDDIHEYQREALGMERLAHHFRVGFADLQNNELVLTTNDQKLWSSAGWSGNADGILGAKDRVGSSKITDPLKRVPETR